MADNLDIRARLTAEDQASPTIKRLLDQIKRLESKLKSGLGKTPITSSIMDDKTMKRLQGAGKEIDGLTQKHLRWARNVRDSGDMTASKWRQMGDQIDGYTKRFNKLTVKEKDHLKTLVKNSQAFKSVWNAASQDRVKAEQRMYNYLGRLEAAHTTRQLRAQQAQSRAEARDIASRLRAERVRAREARDESRLTARAERERLREARRVAQLEAREVANRLRGERAHAREVLENRRRLFRSLRQMTPGYYGQGQHMMRGPGLYALGAAAGTVAMGVSSVRSARDLDRAETNARINMDQGVVNARQLRDTWALPRSVELGQQPARLMQTAVEASKAGVPEAMATDTAEMVTMLAKTFGVEVDQAMEGMGYAIAQEFGAGRLKNMEGVERLGNTAAFLAAKTAARPDQMFSFLRTGMGSGAMMGMSQEATLAFGAAGIQAGAQGQQTARFLGSMGETLSGLVMEAKTIRSQSHRSPKDRKFLSLPGQLGYGSYGEIEDSIRKKPDTAVFDLIKSFGKIKDPIEREQAMTSMFGAEFSRFLANMIASPGMLDRTLKLAQEASGQKQGSNFISEAWGEFTKSLEFFIDRVKATWSVLKSELGDVLKPFIQQFSDWVGDWYRVVRTGGIKERFKAVLEGLTEGFLGKPGSFRDLLDSAFGQPGEGNGGQVKSFFEFARGFATGLREFASGIMSVMQTLGRYFGGGDDAESMGKLAAKITGLVAALALLAPLITVFASVVTLMVALGTALAAIGSTGLAAVLTALGVGAAIAYTPPATRQKGEKYEDWQKRREEHKKNRYKKSGGDGPDPLFQPTSYRSSVDELSDQINKFGGKVERAAFMGNTDFSSRGRTYGSSGGSFGGGLGGLGGSSSGLGVGGSPMDLLKSTPGGVLPNFGVGRSGSIIRNGGGIGGSSSGIVNPNNIPSFSGGGGSSADNVGAGLSGNAFLAARRARFGEELKNDPNLRLHLAAMQMTEGASRGGTIESLMNRSDMQGKSMRQMLGYSADGRINPRSFYGPIRRGELGPAIEKLKRNPKLFEQYDSFTNQALAGSHVIGGHTDQGLPTDPNGSKRTGIPGLRLRDPRTGKLDGNEFTDWVGPGSQWGRGRQGAINYRKAMEQGIAGSGSAPATSSVPTPAEAVQNVPSPIRGDASLGLNGGGRGGGPVAIHINGSSHDPEALATLVQRRVDESMNWRSHDSASEYT